MATSIRVVNRRLPVIVILGATGTGKSKLAIEIANKFNGDIVSTDSMQVYKGLDIITNKVSPEERQQCVHHMIDYIDPLCSQHTVRDFKNKALPIIADLQKQKKIPVIVGGTNYYIEAILWNFLIERKEFDKDALDVSESHFCDASSSELHQQLMEIDPTTAKSLHTNDRRKIIRALQVHKQHGVTKSEILQQQHREPGAGTLSGPLRYPNTCILWIQCQQSVLDQRCDDRVHAMIKSGLVKELQEFHKLYNEKRVAGESTDYTHGIFQSIGFKEFHNYLMLPESEWHSKIGIKLLNEGIETLKTATRRYARYQVKWIQNRFLKRPGANIPPIYAVDSTNPEKWLHDVYTPACEIIGSYLKGHKPTVEPLPHRGERQNRVVHKTCDVCDGRLFVRETEWIAHVSSRSHKKRMSRFKIESRRDKMGNNTDEKHATSIVHDHSDIS